MDKLLLFSVIFLFGQVLSAFAQILLKMSAQVPHTNWIREYLNWKVITAYFLAFLTTVCTIIAYRYVPLSLGAILAVTEYIFVAILSFLFFREKVGKKKLLGLLLIIVGAVVYSI